jgi:hypothetical protein
MADLAAVFHWPPHEMDEMEPDELLRWHKLALERLPRQKKGGRNGRT